MKTKCLILLTGLLLGVTIIGLPAVYRVNNNVNIVVPYTSVTAAYAAASPGDTLLLEGSATTYGGLTISKKIIIIGPGYFLSQNPETQSITSSARLDAVYINSGNANGSRIMGMEINSLTFVTADNIQDIEISRNYITASLYTQYVTVNNILIKQNYLTTLNGSFNNSFIRNNHIVTVTLNSPTNTVVFSNNILTGNIVLTNVQCFNNIMSGTSAICNNSMIAYNICSGTQFPAGSNNQQNVSMSNVYLCWGTCSGYSSDGKFQLKAGSPALLAGSNGEDCGMFGDNDPYILSGMPPIPAIYQFQYFNNNSTLNVIFSAKSHN